MTRERAFVFDADEASEILEKHLREKKLLGRGWEFDFFAWDSCDKRIKVGFVYSKDLDKPSNGS